MEQFKTYEFALFPTEEQREAIAIILDQKDRQFDKLASLSNGYHSFGGSPEEALAAVAAEVQGMPYERGLVRTFRSLIARQASGEIHEIKPCAKHPKRRSFEFSPVRLRTGQVQIPEVGWMEYVMHRSLPVGGYVFSATVIEDVYGAEYRIAFHLIISVAELAPRPVCSDRVIGLDYKQDGLYVDSDGGSGGYPGFWQQSREQVEALYKKAERFKPGSRRWLKFRKQAAKLELHIIRQRRDWQFKRAAALAKEHDAVCVETLNLAQMQRANPMLTPKLRDNNWPGFRNKLGQKLSSEGKKLISVSQYYPSSQICCVCGARFGKRSPSESVIDCPNCGSVFDRDINAARNIRDEGLRMLQAS